MTQTNAETTTGPKPKPEAKTQKCEHWEIEKRDGKTYCRACTRQIYL